MIACPSRECDEARQDGEHEVLIVDDEPSVLASLRRLLRSEPYQVVTLEFPQEALDRIEKTPISLLVADLRMPEMYGTDLIERVRERSPATVCIILTGYPEEGLLERCDALGVRRLLTKPWDDRELKRTIRELLFEYPQSC